MLAEIFKKSCLVNMDKQGKLGHAKCALSDVFLIGRDEKVVGGSQKK